MADFSRVGFVIDGRVPSFAGMLAGRCSPRTLLAGAMTSSSVAEMRFGWIAREVNRVMGYRLKYELYRPWRKYAAVVFLKSMGEECLQLARNLKRDGARIVFDLNVDYLSHASGEEYFDGMLPSEQQTLDARAMVSESDLVIADSVHLLDVARRCTGKACWLPDNVDMTIVPPLSSVAPKGERLRLLWSGESIKLFELLSIKNVLLKLASKVHLVLITNSMDALSRWEPGLRSGFDELMSGLSHEIIEYTSIKHLLEVYSAGGVVLSPRHLDNSYNLGHTEWKITLGMSCGCIAVCSPLASYRKVHELAEGNGIILCNDDSGWEMELSRLASEGVRQDARLAARKVVEDHYSTAVVARKHVEALCSIL